MSKKQSIAVVAVVAVGLVLGALILFFAKPAVTSGGEHGHGHAETHADGEHHGQDGGDDHGHTGGHADEEHHEKAAKKAPHGGQLFSEGSFSVELKLVEAGGEARYQAWLYRDGKPLAATAATLSATLTRPSGVRDEIRFVPAGDVLKSDTAVGEPHVFEGTLAVQTLEEPYLFTFSQAEGRIPLSDAQLATSAITVATAGPAQINTNLQLPGEIHFNQDRTAVIVPRVAGVVEKVSVDLGQQVTRGQVLATIASTELSELRSTLHTAERRLELARETYTREKKLWEEKISAEQDFLQARKELREAEIAVANAREQLQTLGVVNNSGALNRYELRAPFDGMIVKKGISMGEAVKDDAEVFTLSDLSTVWADIVVPAKDLNRVRVGDNVVVRATAFDSEAAGTVSYVGSLVGEQTRAAIARVTLKNPELVWRPGLSVNVAVTEERADVPVAVRADAVQALEGEQVVFVRVPGGFVPQPVKLGRSDGQVIEVVAGLTPGVPYASEGSFIIKSELGKASVEHSH